MSNHFSIFQSIKRRKMLARETMRVEFASTETNVQ